MTVAPAGLALIGIAAGASAGLVAFTITVAAGLSWAISNIVTRTLGRVNALSLVVWSSLVLPVSMLVLSLIFEGPGHVATALTHRT